MKKIKVNFYTEAKTVIILNARIAFVDNIQNRFGFWFNNEIKVFGKLTSWSVDISQQINFVMISFNYTRELEEFIDFLRKNDSIIKEYK